MIGADRCAVSGDDIVFKSGTTLAACFNAIDAFQVLALANGVEASNIAGLMGAFLRFELQQYAIHRSIGERVRSTHGPTQSHEQ
jgi:hypothetical protein